MSLKGLFEQIERKTRPVDAQQDVKESPLDIVIPERRPRQKGLVRQLLDAEVTNIKNQAAAGVIDLVHMPERENNGPGLVRRGAGKVTEAMKSSPVNNLPKKPRQLVRLEDGSLGEIVKPKKVNRLGRAAGAAMGAIGDDLENRAAQGVVDGYSRLSNLPKRERKEKPPREGDGVLTKLGRLVARGAGAGAKVAAKGVEGAASAAAQGVRNRAERRQAKRVYEQAMRQSPALRLEAGTGPKLTSGPQSTDPNVVEGEFWEVKG